jgi:hypothetical protein
VAVEDATVALKLLVDRRDGLGGARTEAISRLHHLLLELVPGGAKQFLSAPQARALLTTIRPRDILGCTRRQLAAEVITEVAVIDKKIKAANAQLTNSSKPRQHAATVAQHRPVRRRAAARRHQPLRQPGPFRLLERHRPHRRVLRRPTTPPALRAGKRRINRVLHIMAIVQLRNDTEGRAYYRRKLAAGKSPMEAMRSLKRRLSNVV